jgi:hypothetical protein
MVITTPALVNHGAWSSEVCYNFQKKHDTEENRKSVKTVSDQFDETYMRHETGWADDENIAKIMNLCNSQSNYDLNPFQRLCLKQMIQCMAQLICGNPPANVLALYLKKYNMAVAKTKMVFLGTSRRGGKTDIMTMVVAAMLIVCPNVKLLYYSIFDRTCEVACATVLKWIQAWGYGHMVTVKRKMQLTLQGESETDKRVVIFINGQSVDVNPQIYIYFYILLFLSGVAIKDQEKQGKTIYSILLINIIFRGHFQFLFGLLWSLVHLLCISFKLFFIRYIFLLVCFPQYRGCRCRYFIGNPTRFADSSHISNNKALFPCPRCQCIQHFSSAHVVVVCHASNYNIGFFALTHVYRDHISAVYFSN